MTISPRRSLGAGPAKPIRAAEADLVRELPGIGFPDLDGLRARRVLGPPPATWAPQPHRVLGARPSEVGQAQ
ncbi:hypothetical protein ACH4OX_36400 [Streptomyces roseolus]|uniref:hypothetical protein n=1 Tax=Streptomyces roseolus TaxID=67358 RepID=UPI00379DAC5F